MQRRREYKKREWQKFKEKYKLPWSLKTLTDFWEKLPTRGGLKYRDEP